jgi:hypothetical protein
LGAIANFVVEQSVDAARQSYPALTLLASKKRFLIAAALAVGRTASTSPRIAADGGSSMMKIQFADKSHELYGHSTHFMISHARKATLLPLRYLYSNR